MKYKNIIISLILLSSCNYANNTSDNNSMSINNILKSKNNIANYLYYYNDIKDETNLLDKVEVIWGSINQYYNGTKPDFIIAGDNIKLNYYGDIITNGVTLDTPLLGNYYTIDGEIDSFEYIKANVENVQYKINSYENGKKYIEISETKFNFIITDKEYHFCSINDIDENEVLYASYYNNVAQALYSFNPLM